MIAALLGLSAQALGQDRIGTAAVIAPVGWSKEKSEPTRLVFRSNDGLQTATITVLEFGKEPSFEDFNRMCDLRIKAEKEFLKDGSVLPSAPFKTNDAFGMFFSGSDKKVGRNFSGYLALRKKELFTVYVEGTGGSASDHCIAFKAFVTGFRLK